jgi:hypothetical protein
MTGVRGTGNTHCGRRLKADVNKHGVRWLTCTLPRYHSGDWHKHRYTGWMWWTGPPGFTSNRPPEIVREWSCRGWIVEKQRVCGATYVGTEDAARVKGWKILAEGLGHGDQLCPQCGKPDPETLKLLHDLERSVAR